MNESFWNYIRFLKKTETILEIRFRRVDILFNILIKSLEKFYKFATMKM